jgi:AcrR family transcriptional regulator
VVVKARMTRVESQEATRRLLVEAAAGLYQSKGFHRTSVADIAKAAGFTTGAVYSNFATKQDIALAVLASDAAGGWDDFNSAVAGAGTVEELLSAVLKWRVRALAHQSPLATLRMELSLPSNDAAVLHRAVAASQQALRETLAALLEAAAEAQGARLLVPAETLAASILALFDGTAIASGIEPTCPHHEAFAFGLASVVMAGFEPSSISADEWPAVVKRLMARARRLRS